MAEITFVVHEDPVDGGYTAQAHWPIGNRDIVTEGNSRDELIRNIRKAIEATFGENEQQPAVIHLHFVRESRDEASA